MSYNLMLYSGEKKMSRFARQKKNILSLVLSEKKILNETKNHKWSVPLVSLNYTTSLLQGNIY
jgi:hypothetical protein